MSGVALVDVGVSAGVAPLTAQPIRALFTAAIISVMVISPFRSASPLVQVKSAVPRAMFTIMMSSFTVTSPLLSQSPVHALV